MKRFQMLAHLARSSSFVLQQQQRCFSRGAFLLKGHSKWQNIKDTKGKNDALRARQISYLLTKVKSAVKSGGFDMKLNQQLVAVQQEFRAQSLPLETFNNYLAKMKVTKGSIKMIIFAVTDFLNIFKRFDRDFWPQFYLIYLLLSNKCLIYAKTTLKLRIFYLKVI